MDGSLHSSIKFIIGEIIRSGCRHSVELFNLAWRLFGIDNAKGLTSALYYFDDTLFVADDSLDGSRE